MHAIPGLRHHVVYRAISSGIVPPRECNVDLCGVRLRGFIGRARMMPDIVYGLVDRQLWLTGNIRTGYLRLT